MKITRTDSSQLKPGDFTDFRRQTTLKSDTQEIFVSTCGPLIMPNGHRTGIGYTRFYETMVFAVDKDGHVDYHELPTNSPWAIAEDHAEDRAIEMHETMVKEVMDKMMEGHTFQRE